MGETIDVGDTWKVGSIVKERPTLRFSPNGKAWTKFSISVQPRPPKDGPKPEKVFYDVTAFGTLAEHFCECFDKGDRIFAAGRAQLEHWTSNTGEARTTKKIIAEAGGADVTFAGVDVHRGSKPVLQSATAVAPAYTDESEAPF